MRSWKKLSPARSFRPALLNLEDRTVPAADLFADAPDLTGAFATDSTTNYDACAEAGEPTDATSGAINSVWWKWTATRTGLVEVNTFGSELDTILGVYTGDAVDNLALVAMNDDALDSQSQVVFEATAGTTYRIAVDGYEDSTGHIALTLGTAPANDDFAGATVAAGGTVTGANLAATAEAGEPLGAGDNAPANSVWWSWTASAGGRVTIDTVGSNFDTVLAVYTGSAVDNLTLVAQNDDFDFPNTLASRVAFDAVAGATYRVAVDGYLNETGYIVLNLPDAPPGNSAPVVADQSFAANENAAAGTVVGTVAASDPDAGQTLSYAIVDGNTSGAFAIDAATGRITVANPAALDYDANAAFDLIVQVTDDGTPALSAGATVRIALSDLNESPVFAPHGSFGVSENAAAGTVVGTVSASDADAGQTLTYAITGGNGSGAFAIDAATGRITVADPASLNYEVKPSYTLTVSVTDSGEPALGCSTTVAVNLADVNDAPVLDNSGSMALNSISTGQTNNSGTLVADLLASAGGNRITDQDAGAVRGIAIVAADTSHGSWQFSTNGGATWASLGAVSNGSARLLAADAKTRVRFVPGFLYSGTVTDALTFRAWDQTAGVNGGLADTGAGGGSSAFSTATETASIRVKLLGLL